MVGKGVCSLISIPVTSEYRRIKYIQVVILNIGTHRNIVVICLFGGPRKSSLTRCSSIQMTTAIIRNERAVTPHISSVKGLRKTQALDSEVSMGATMTRPVDT